jgi:hypothetical protein
MNIPVHPSHSWIIDKLDRKFNVVEYIDLLSVDTDFEMLKQELLLSRLDSYTKNDRYVIFDEDTHYYIDGCSYSLTWYNIIKMFLDADIPLNSIIVFYNGSGLLEQILTLIPRELQNENCIPTIIDNRSKLWLGRGEQIFINNFNKHRTVNTHITKHAITMMGQKRIHRNILQNHIKENNLLDKIAVAYNNVS